jgi:hypothetical protein
MIHAHIKKNPARANPSWQTPANILRALSEPIPGIAKFIIMHDHARSRLNGRSGEKGIGIN